MKGLKMNNVLHYRHLDTIVLLLDQEKRKVPVDG